MLRTATRSLRAAALHCAEILTLQSHFQEGIKTDAAYYDHIWEFIEDLLVCAYIARLQSHVDKPPPESIFKILHQNFNPHNGEAVPWSLSNLSRRLLNETPEIFLPCIESLKEIPCDPQNVWVLGSLYEYRTGLLLEQDATGEERVRLVKNVQKKRQAIYYTPPDVVDFIVQHSLSPFLSKIKQNLANGLKDEALFDFLHLSVLDPSCGGGAFLLPVWKCLLQFFNDNFPAASIPPLEHPLLVGVDVDPLAVRVSQFSLWLITPRDHPLARGYAVLEGNSLWPKGSKNIPKFSFEEAFPALFSPKTDQGFSCVIGNPPYAEIPPAWRNDAVLASHFHSTASKDLYTLFIEQMVHLTQKQKGRGGMIVPLSLTFSKDMQSIRDFIMQSGRLWKISSYHIRPSGIFPGVSQRTSIVLMEPSLSGNTRVETTFVQRWTAENRANLFANLTYADVTECINLIAKQNRQLGFPNLGHPVLSRMLENLLRGENKLGDTVIQNKNSIKNPSIVYYFTMAYQWLSLSTQLPQNLDADKEVALSSLIPLSFQDPDVMWISLALLASSLGFWWWQVFGDLFHVTQKILTQFPINPVNIPIERRMELKKLAVKLQMEINHHVTFFTKKGITNANFDLTGCFQQIQQIDQVLWDYLQLSREEVEAIYAYYKDTTGQQFPKI